MQPELMGTENTVEEFAAVFPLLSACIFYRVRGRAFLRRGELISYVVVALTTHGTFCMLCLFSHQSSWSNSS
ncbi:hypothetical protein GIB67_009029 [Kingdonia uniflora]|uniref:Uncharacterized protein n=1 Tax=Kingdonia uniflora TaxID=39325 RepID=A0A7J7LVS1_9MAGN|nr:hypothetical protein GIB67_009029 [Kingdonia uniflora]